MSDDLNHLLVERPEPGLMVVRFNRPEVHNALNTATSVDLYKVFGKLAFHPGDVRCVILTAAGERAFSAGGDLKERQGMSDEAWRAQHAIIDSLPSRPSFIDQSIAGRDRLIESLKSGMAVVKMMGLVATRFGWSAVGTAQICTARISNRSTASL